MAKTRLKANQVNEDTLQDADNNTKVMVEKNANENKIRFDTAGTERMIIDETGKLGIGVASPTSPLHVYGNLDGTYIATIDNDSGSNGHGLKVTSDGTGTGTTILDVEAGSTTVFKIRGDGRVGIGVATPGSTLSVDDEIAVGEKLIHRGDPDTYLQFPGNDTMNLVAGGSSFFKFDGTDILINNANQNRDTKIMADNGAVVVHVDAGDNRVGIGTTSPTEKLDVNGTAKATTVRTALLEYTDGDDAITIEDGGYLKFHAGVKYARSVKVNSSSSPGAAGGNPDGGWAKFATFNCSGTSGLDTAASSFLITLAGMESSNNRRLDGIFMVHAKFTVNTGGNADGGSNYYESEGTRISCEPLNADYLAPAGADDFDPSTDLIMITTNDDSTPVVDLYIRSRAKAKYCFVTHLGGTGQTDTFDTDPGWTINTGEGWSATEPAAPGGSAKITGTWVSKVFSKVTAFDKMEANALEANSMTVKVRDVNSTSAVQDTDYVLRCIQNQAITITLPAKASSQGRVLVIKDTLGNANSNNITIDGDSSDTIDGSATYVISHNKEAVTLICDGINGWMITSRIRP